MSLFREQHCVPDSVNKAEEMKFTELVVDSVFTLQATLCVLVFAFITVVKREEC